MLRLIRNFLFLATALQVGTAVQAQPQPAKVAASSAPKSLAVGLSSKAATKDAAPSKSEPAKVKTDTAATAKAQKTVKHSAHPGPGLVPPPPPDTPTVFADGIFPGFGVPDYANPAILAGRRKDIASQLASAKKLLADKEQRSKELKEKATQFEQLFSEGVISRRELESAQKDAVSAATELNDARTQIVAYQNAMTRLDERIKPKSSVVKKNLKTKAVKTQAAKVPSVQTQSDKTKAAKMPAERMQAEKTQADKAQSDKAQSDKAQADKAQAGRAQADKAQVDKMPADKTPTDIKPTNKS
ncbi:MAG: hypothetical protein U0103_22925 [Candidatus Obscuribacterales bacterium]